MTRPFKDYTIGMSICDTHDVRTENDIGKRFAEPVHVTVVSTIPMAGLGAQIQARVRQASGKESFTYLNKMLTVIEATPNVLKCMASYDDRYAIFCEIRLKVMTDARGVICVFSPQTFNTIRGRQFHMYASYVGETKLRADGTLVVCEKKNAFLATPSESTFPLDSDYWKETLKKVLELSGG